MACYVLPFQAVVTKIAVAYACVRSDGEIPGVRRFHTHDPFGNRVEFQQA
jgi:hypothetical protein